MKKIIILAIATLPLFTVAQDRTPVNTATKTTESKFALATPEVIHLELIIGANQLGGTSIRADIGREISNSLADKEMAKQLVELRTTQFPSVPDAMNYLASIGFKMLTSYETTDKDNKSETHLLMEKKIVRRPNPANRPEATPAATQPEAKPAEAPKQAAGKGTGQTRDKK